MYFWWLTEMCHPTCFSLCHSNVPFPFLSAPRATCICKHDTDTKAQRRRSWPFNASRWPRFTASSLCPLKLFILHHIIFFLNKTNNTKHLYMCNFAMVAECFKVINPHPILFRNIVIHLSDWSKTPNLSPCVWKNSNVFSRAHAPRIPGVVHIN